MADRKTVLLALATPHHGMARGVARYAREHDWRVIPDMLYGATIPYGWQGDGIISHVEYWNELADFVVNAAQPCVELTNVRQDLNLPCVKADNRMIGSLAAKHFLARSYWYFAWAPFTHDIANDERLRGFHQELQKHGFGCEVLPPQHSLDKEAHLTNWSSQRQRLIIKLQELSKPLAIFCYNDCVAVNILYLCEEAEIKVPEEVIIMGTDNDVLLCDSLRIPLSSVLHDLEEMGYKGAELLDRLMEGDEPPKEPPIVTPKGIIARQSTDMIAVESVEVAKALRYIWEHYQNPFLHVDDIVAATNLSRRPLELTFRREVGRTINTVIKRTRLKQAKQYLRHSEKNIEEIAHEIGFSYTNYFYAVFREHVGSTPEEYRRMNAKEDASS